MPPTTRSLRVRRAACPPCRTRRGFTLLEVLVATLVLLTGLVGVATATAAALRTLADARLEEDSAIVAGRRLELLRGTPCIARVGGERVDGTLVERWTVTPRADGATTSLVVTVAPRAHPARARRYETVAPC